MSDEDKSTEVINIGKAVILTLAGLAVGALAILITNSPYSVIVLPWKFHLPLGKGASAVAVVLLVLGQLRLWKTVLHIILHR